MKIKPAKSVVLAPEPIGIFSRASWTDEGADTTYAMLVVDWKQMESALHKPGPMPRGKPYYVAYHEGKLYLYPATDLGGELSISFYPPMRRA